MNQGNDTPVLSEVDGSVGWVTLNRPEVLNAMNEPLMDSLLQTLRTMSEDQSIRAVVLRGSGRAFSAGGDVKMMADRQAGVAKSNSMGAVFADQQRDLIMRSESSVLLRTMPKPTIAALRGHVVGGALALALACDLRIAAEDTQLRVGFSGRGLSGDFGISYLLYQAVGSMRARELMLIDQAIDSRRAIELGLVTEVCPVADFEARIKEIANELGSGPTIAYARIKANLEQAAIAPSLREAIAIEASNQRVSAMTADSRESGVAFNEKRPPIFKGR